MITRFSLIILTLISTLIIGCTTAPIQPETSSDSVSDSSSNQIMSSSSTISEEDGSSSLLELSSTLGESSDARSFGNSSNDTQDPLHSGSSDDAFNSSGESSGVIQGSLNDTFWDVAYAIEIQSKSYGLSESDTNTAVGYKTYNQDSLLLQEYYFGAKHNSLYHFSKQSYRYSNEDSLIEHTEQYFNVNDSNNLMSVIEFQSANRYTYEFGSNGKLFQRVYSNWEEDDIFEIKHVERHLYDEETNTVNLHDGAGDVVGHDGIVDRYVQYNGDYSIFTYQLDDDGELSWCNLDSLYNGIVIAKYRGCGDESALYESFYYPEGALIKQHKKWSVSDRTGYPEVVGTDNYEYDNGQLTKIEYTVRGEQFQVGASVYYKDPVVKREDEFTYNENGYLALQINTFYNDGEKKRQTQDEYRYLLREEFLHIFADLNPVVHPYFGDL